MKRALLALPILITVGAITLYPTTAAAHVPDVYDECAGLHVSLTQYESTAGAAFNNRVTITIDGTPQVFDFDASFVQTFTWDQTANHTWTVVIDANRNNGNATQYDTSFQGSETACQTPTTTTTTTSLAPTTTSTTTSTTTTTTTTEAPTSTSTSTSSTSTTLASTTTLPPSTSTTLASTTTLAPTTTSTSSTTPGTGPSTTSSTQPSTTAASTSSTLATIQTTTSVATAPPPVPPTGPGALPPTGGDTGLLLVFAGGALVLGGLTIAAVRRKP